MQESHCEVCIPTRYRLNDNQLTISSAYLRPRQASPSHKMAALSHKFSTTSIHADLPLQAPERPTIDAPLSLASHFYNQSSDNFGLESSSPQLQGRQALDISGDSASSYSSFGDLLPDEVAENTNKSNGLDRNSVHGVNAHGLKPSQRSNGDNLTDQRHRPKPLQLNHERRFSFDEGDDSGFDFPELPWSKEGVAGLRRSLSLSDLQETHDRQTRPAAQLRRLETPKTATNFSPLPSPLLPASPGLSKIPSPVFDASLAKRRREDSTSSLITAVKHSDTGTLHSRKGSGSTSRRSNTSSGPADASLHSPQAVSNRSSSESGKRTGGERLVREKNSLRRNQVALAAARAAGVSSARSSASEVVTSQRGSASGHPKQSRFENDDNSRTKENVGSTTRATTRETSARHK